MIQHSAIKSLKGLLFVLCLATIITLQQSHAQDNTTKIRTHDPSSRIAINYENMNLLFKATVTRARTSSRIYARKSSSGIGTKVNFSNGNPTRLEASRVFYHLIGDEELEYVHLLRLGMEALSQVVPLQNLNRNEQLAYWLNLYNIVVYDELAQRYPIRKLDKLYNGTRKTPSMWDEKMINVNGIALSLNDIQYNIIQKTWKDPRVMYGLYQGTIGGPNLRRIAYTGRSVYEKLEDNAEEFINSLRGLRFKGKEAHVSKIYEWNKELFPNFKQDLRRHLRKYAKFRLVTRLDSTRKIKTKIYDWHIADVLNGGYDLPGGAASTNPVGLLFSFGGEESTGLGEFATNVGDGGNIAAGVATTARMTQHTNKAIDTSVLRPRLSDKKPDWKQAGFFIT